MPPASRTWLPRVVRLTTISLLSIDTFIFIFFYFLVTNNDRSVELFVINGDVSGLVVIVNFCGHDDVRTLVLVISSGPNEVVATHLVPTLR